MTPQLKAKQGAPMTEKIQSLYVITGPRGVGKTTLAATFMPPSRIGEVVYMDAEKSANNTRANLRADGLPDFGMYIDLEDRFSDLPSDDDLLDRIGKGKLPWESEGQRNAMIDYYLYIIKCLRDITPGKYSTFVLDPAQKLEYGMRAWSDQYNTKNVITKTDHGKLDFLIYRPLYESLINAIWNRGISTIILNFHLKDYWFNDKPVPNKVEMAGNKVLFLRASLMLWLVNEPKNPYGEPAGLVMKERLGSVKRKTDASGKPVDEWDTRRRLPPRIPTCTWAEIARYLREGFDPKNPKPGEVPSDEERNMIGTTLNEMQMALMFKDVEIEANRTNLAMAEAGLIMPSMSLGVESPQVFASNNGVPHTRTEAISVWTSMGRKVPELLKRLRERGVGDDQISERWADIVDE